MSTTTGPDLTAIKQRQQATWASGDYSRIGVRLVHMAEELCEAADVRSGERVLDVAAGSGNAALAAARRGCETTALDYVPTLLEAARERAAAEGLAIDAVEGDAEQMPFADASFDVLLSTVGVMFAPDHARTASELARVCRPGGRIALASWAPDSFIGELFRTVGAHVPPPAGLQPPGLWGTEAHLREIFGATIGELRAERRTFAFRFRSPEDMVDTFIGVYGPTLRAHESLDADGRERFREDFLALVRRHDRGDGRGSVVPSDYLQSVAVRA